ncbi:MAG: B12-binding domain-containing radical SAM protein [Planctomycetota bacterium]|nr:B12-binding domain-containing radical SAM protein [Planctomycetota bacterium]
MANRYGHFDRFPATGGRRRLRVIAPAFPAFNIYSRIARRTTALGPVCVATSAREVEGWDAEVIDENNYRLHGPRDAAGMPDHAAIQRLRPARVVGLYGGLTSTIPRLYELARLYRSLGAVPVAGGQHFVGENIREALESGVDFVCIGEGEETIKELLAIADGRLRPEQVRGIAWMENGEVRMTQPRDPIRDFDRLPLPDFSLVRYAKIDIYPVSRVRGCGMDCEFCTVKGKARYASVDRLMEQFRYMTETFDARRFFIVDDLFGQNREETIRFCDMLAGYQRDIGRAMDITVQIRLDKARDIELLRAMRRASINTVAIGFESPIREELQAMNKRLSPEDMIAYSRVYHKLGFLVHGMFIFGYPLAGGATIEVPLSERVARFRRFIRRAKIDTLQVLLPVPLPGTELRQRLQAEGRIFPKESVGWEYYDGNFPLFKPDEPLTARDLSLAHRKLMGWFYRFRYMFLIGLNVLSFPFIVFFLHNLRLGWGLWYRAWHDSLVRFGGWLLMRRWERAYRDGGFARKLAEACRKVGGSASGDASVSRAEALGPATRAP